MKMYQNQKQIYNLTSHGLPTIPKNVSFSLEIPNKRFLIFKEALVYKNI